MAPLSNKAACEFKSSCVAWLTSGSKNLLKPFFFLFPKWHGFFQSPGNMKASCVTITILFKSFFFLSSHFLELLGKSRLYFSFSIRYSFFIWCLDKACLDWIEWGTVCLYAFFAPSQAELKAMKDWRCDHCFNHRNASSSKR